MRVTTSVVRHIAEDPLWRVGLLQVVAEDEAWHLFSVLAELGAWGAFVVFDTDQTGRVLRLLERLGHDERHVLAGVTDAVVLKGNHGLECQSPTRHRAPGRQLLPPVDAIDRGADASGGAGARRTRCGTHAAPPISERARTTARSASRTLKALSRTGRAPRTATAPASAIAAASRRPPTSTSSAARARHGLGATPPSATRAELTVPSTSSIATAVETRGTRTMRAREP